MTPFGRRLVGGLAIAAPALHSITDLMEWLQHGFSPTQLWLNYLAFLPVPALMLGLYAAQRPRIGLAGLAGAWLYGAAFIYFAHTTLLALGAAIPDYEDLLGREGPRYRVHGLVMAIGGVLFGGAALRARMFPRWTSLLFITGITLNTLLALTGAPAALQPLGTVLRNLGLIGMGQWLARSAETPG